MVRRNIVYVLDDDPDMLRGLERLLKVHGFCPKLFQSTEAFLASVDNAMKPFASCSMCI